MQGWLADGITVVISKSKIKNSYAGDIQAVNSQTGEITPIVSDVGYPSVRSNMGIYTFGSLVSPAGNYIAYRKCTDPDSYICELRTIGSLLNLTARLSVMKQSTSILLRGTAQDLHFEQYQLEYSDVRTPDQWSLIAPPSDVPVVNDVFTTWVPPHEGSFYVRLSVWDKAGNVRRDRKRVSWGLTSSITNLYKTREIFSPNGDGIQDIVEVHYTVLEPGHLDFYIHDSADNLVRSISMDHPSIGDGHITWDGRDENGAVVPDGKYRIMVYDFDLFVYADTTPPLVHVTSSKLMQVPSRDVKGQYDLAVDLSGYAVDEHLRSWIVEYGEGNNPLEWTPLASGNGLLVGRDEKGDPLLDPIRAARIKTYKENRIEQYLVGNRLRITAEDFGGGKSSQIGAFLSEEIIFDRWDEKSFSIQEGLIANTSGPTKVGVRETVRERIAEMTVQYNEGAGWIDARSVTYPDSGRVEIEWDTSGLGDALRLVRVKAVDALGDEYVSNVARTNSFAIRLTCDGLFLLNYMEDLALLKIQLKSDQDPDYGVWTDIETYGPEEIPTGGIFKINLPVLDSLKNGISYMIRAASTDSKGQHSETGSLLWPPALCPGLEIEIDHEESPSCGKLAPGRAVLTAYMNGIEDPEITRRTMTYSIRKPDNSVELLKTLDLTSLDFSNMSMAFHHGRYYWEVKTAIDISTLSVGKYPIKGLLEVETLKGKGTDEAAVEMIVDRTLPIARITYPAESLFVCAVNVSGTPGDKYVVRVEGRATDDNRVKGYELYYGNAKTPVSGKGAKEGNLGDWDVTGLRDQAPLITLRVTDVAGNVSCHTTSFFLDNGAEITGLTANRPLFSPNGDGILDDVMVTYEIQEHAQVDVKVFEAIRTLSGSYTLGPTVIRTIVSGRSHLGGWGSVTWDGKDGGGNIVADGKYGIAVFAADSCQNTAQKFVVVAVQSTTTDTTPPDVVIYAPAQGDLYGNIKSTVAIAGGVLEENLDQYTLRYGAGESPATWMALTTGTTLPLPSPLFTWNVGKTGGIPDGLYTVSLYARDRSGLEGEAKVRITIDNTPTEVSVASPLAGNYVTGATDIKGTAADPNLDSYTIEFSGGQCNIASKWATMAVGKTPVMNEVLATWKSIPADGDYCVRLTAIDKLGNKAEAKVGLKVDTHPPAAPVLSGQIENKVDTSLNWTQNTEVDLRGYNLYRNNQKINTDPIADPGYLDRNLGDGSYTYVVKAVDLAGLESPPSNQIRIKVDLTGPDARISSPRDGARVGGLVNIKGTAFSLDDFKQYRVYIGPGSNPSTWNLIRTSPVPVSYGTLTDWDTLGLAEGPCSIRLEAEDLLGNINALQVTVAVDNTPPAAPVLISATPTGSDVALAWQANTETDLAGYLLYRNDQLANGTGIVIGDLKGYLISGTTYLDKTLPDGKARYYLVAMDQAANTSNPSNAIEVTIDTRPPKATITVPADKSKFDKKNLIKAESPDIDIASVQFQYKRASDTTWVNLDDSFTKSPYVTYLDPIALGLTYGDYNVRAVATDAGSKTDPAPALITLTYTDLTPPASPVALKAMVNGKDVALTWATNTEADLDGYNIYRTLAGTRTKVNPSIVKAVTYGDANLSDGSYTYEITAVDTYGNESDPTAGVSARVYAPLLSQPITPTGQTTVFLQGSNAEAGSSVEISIDVEGTVTRVTVPSDSTGKFSSDLPLAIGENRITAKATDGAGNISRTSNEVVVVHDEPPSAPTGLSASVEGSNVKLTWNPNPETDIAGYHVYRDGERLDLPARVTSGTATASSSYSVSLPSYAFDNNPATFWKSNYSNPFTPAWWEIALPSPGLIKHIEIDWAIPGKDYEIQAWSGSAWISLASITGNGAEKNVLDFSPYRTDRIRIYITATTDTNWTHYVGISEVRILKDNSVTLPVYDDLNLPNGTYVYAVTAVDWAGSESPPSNEISAAVNIAPPVAPINLQVSSLPEGKSLRSDWEYTGVPPGGYNLYRSTTSGGPYVKANNALITETSCIDRGLTNGVAYFYVVVAVDSLGNESPYSNEATGIPSDSVAPAKPVIFFPASSGSPATVSKHKTVISGSAEPVSNVELFKDGVFGSAAPAMDTDSFQAFDLGSNLYGAAVSPDGNTIAYIDASAAVWLKNLATDNLTQILPQADSLLWSLDGGRIAYIDNGRIGLFDFLTQSASLLTEDTGADEVSPSWSDDGTKIAFITDRSGDYDVWVKDLVSGVLSQATTGKYTYTAKLSPDGNKVAYFEDEELYVVDLVSGETLTVDLATDEESIDWSPDSTKLAFVSSRNGNYDVFVLDLDTQNQTQLTDSPQWKWNLCWSPDGQEVAFLRWETNGTASIVAISSSVPGQGDVLKENLPAPDYLAWTKSGVIAYAFGSEWTMVQRKGYFRFEGIELNQGENRFYATATDSSGNMGDSSDEVLIIFDTGLLPDLEITAEDILVYPFYPISGEDVLVSVDVRNRGGVEARNVNVDIYLGHPDGPIEFLTSRDIPSIAPGSGDTIGVVWNSGGKPGRYTVIAVADPTGEIEEVTEENNTSTRDFIVIEGEGGIFIAASLDSGQYRSYQDVGIQLDLINSGPERNVDLEVWIEDQEGYAVASVSTSTMSLPYGSEQMISLIWNTGSTYAGPYWVHPIVKGTSGVIAETTVPFTILPDIDVGVTVVTDKSRYGANEDVFITAKVKNNGTNYIISNPSAKLRILNGSGGELFSEEKTVVNFFPGTTIALSSTWPTGLNPPGDYSAIIEVILDGSLMTSRTAAFKIDPDSMVFGYITATPPVVILGKQAYLDYRVRNDGNADLNGFMVRASVIDPATQDVMIFREETVNLGKGTSWSGEFSFSTQGYALKTYWVVLEGNSGTIASTAMTLIDATPPAVSVISPSPNSYASTIVLMAVIASDDASGVDTVEYQIDDKGWNFLPSTDVSLGRHGAVWTPGDSDRGVQLISFRATDRAGNRTSPIERRVTVVASLSPVANAGLDQDVLTGQTATLNGNGSYDPEGAPLTFRWRFKEVPPGSAVNDTSLSDPESATPAFVPDWEGAYILELIVNDGALDSDPDDVRVVASTPNISPTAIAGPDQNVATEVEVHLDGSDSYDPDGQLLSFLWSLENKPLASSLTDADIEGKTTPNPSFTPDVDGVYRLRLVVNDGFTGSAPDTVEIHSFPSIGNIPPNAQAGKDRHARVNTLVVLDGSASYDRDDGPADLMTFQWSFKAVPPGSALPGRPLIDSDQVSASFVPDVAGSYTVELQVNDGAATDTDEVMVVAYSTNVPPNARAGQDRKVEPGHEVTLDGTMSFDPDEGPESLAYQWRFMFVPQGSTLTNGSIINAHTATPKFTPDVEGAYVVELTVSDSEAADFDHVMVIATTEPWVEVTQQEGTIGTEFTLKGHNYEFGSAKGKLYMGKRALKAVSWASESIFIQVKKPNPPGTYDIKILPKKPKGGTQQTIWEPRCFTVRVPEVGEVTYVSAEQRYRVTGKFFGTKKGKIYLGELACKVMKWTMNPATNESEATFLLPKGITPGTYLLNVVNKVGRGKLEVSVP